MMGLPLRLRRMPAMVAGCILALAGSATIAQTGTPAEPLASVAPAKGVGTPPVTTQSVTFRQLGTQFPLQLRGIDGRNGVGFSVQADQIVTAAQVRLLYSYSPSMLPEISQLNVMVNEEVVASLPVNPADGGKILEAVVDIPARLITDFNRLNMQLIGHYTLECEDPVHSSLWANISNDSELRLSIQSLAMQNDLAQLPLPFFDRRNVRRLQLPFVFVGQPAGETLEAAGVVASWFGSQADYRGAIFPVRLSSIPASGHAIVIMQGNQRLPGMTEPAASGPGVAIMQNPNDPRGKLLVVSGRDSNELRTAALALTVGNQTLSGDRAIIHRVAELIPRKPYDAPNWLRSDRPVELGELVDSQELNVSGFTPRTIRVPLRVPPDLFGWRERGIELDLKYRYTPPEHRNGSVLNIDVGGQFVRTLQLDHVPPMAESQIGRLAAGYLPDPARQHNEQLHLPLYMLPSQSQLQFRYSYTVPGGECISALPDSIRASVQPDSTLDISKLQHFMAMPDLAAFGTAGFPFTRMADLSETAVVLPDNASATDYAVYLTLMGRMGSASGYPATGVSVVQANQVSAVANKDLLVIASGANQPLVNEWSDVIPFGRQGDSREFKVSDMVYRAVSWLKPGLIGNEQPGRAQVALATRGSDAILAGFESPLASKRSVVLLSGDRPESLYAALDTLMDTDKDLVSRVQGSLVVIRGDQVNSLAAEQSYYIGRLDPITYARWFLGHKPLLLFGVAALAAVLLALILYLVLRARARRRLIASREDE